jgi:hypothetical protein
MSHIYLLETISTFFPSSFPRFISFYLLFFVGISYIDTLHVQYSSSFTVPLMHVPYIVFQAMHRVQRSKNRWSVMKYSSHLHLSPIVRVHRTLSRTIFFI